MILMAVEELGLPSFYADKLFSMLQKVMCLLTGLYWVKILLDSLKTLLRKSLISYFVLKMYSVCVRKVGYAE